MELPRVVLQLTNLRKLVISKNVELKHLDPELMAIKTLTDLDCDGCTNLQHPPYEGVANLGCGQIRQFFRDQAVTGETSALITICTIAVVGRKMAGKTSLVQSLKSRMRILTNREEDAPFDETTRVFSSIEIELDGLPVQIFDFGGDDAYQTTYQLVLRSNSIPVVVVNLKHFEQLAAAFGDLVAAKELVINWFAHFYLVYPQLTSTILIITHQDAFSESNYTAYRERLLLACNQWKSKIFLSGNSRIEIKAFTNRHQPMFIEADIFEVGKHTSTTFNRIASRLLHKIQEKDCRTVIPFNWYKIIKFLQKERFDISSHLSLRDLNAKFKKDGITEAKIKNVLRYAHMAGYLLWFEDSEELSSYVFHNMDMIVELLEIVFNHDEEKKWSFREDNFQPYLSYNEPVVEKKDFKQWLIFFNKTSLLLDHLFKYLVRTESKLAFSHAVKILQHFNLLYEHEDGRTDLKLYLIPSFARRKIDISFLRGSTLILCTSFAFKGLKLPRHAYHQMSILLLNLHRLRAFNISLYSNGLAAQNSLTKFLLQYETEESEMQFKVSACANTIHSSWEILVDSILTIMRYLHQSWRALQYLCEYLCPHCLLQGCPDPGRLEKSGFLAEVEELLESGESSGVTWINEAVDERKCLNITNPDLIPASFIHPCKFSFIHPCKYFSSTPVSFPHSSLYFFSLILASFYIYS